MALVIELGADALDPHSVNASEAVRQRLDRFEVACDVDERLRFVPRLRDAKARAISCPSRLVEEAHLVEIPPLKERIFQSFAVEGAIQGAECDRGICTGRRHHWREPRQQCQNDALMLTEPSDQYDLVQN